MAWHSETFLTTLARSWAKGPLRSKLLRNRIWCRQRHDSMTKRATNPSVFLTQSVSFSCRWAIFGQTKTPPTKRFRRSERY